MGQKNNAICGFLSDPAIFADFINGSVHNGEQVVSPKQLSDRETVSYQKQSTRPSFRQPSKYIERQRDTLKAVFHGDCYIVVGIEAQDKVNYTMPIRCMEYDVTEYKRQLKELRSSRKEGLSGDEFLSGMAKNEKLNPVTTIVFYHGEEPYDGCTNLYDMLELKGENQTYKRFVADYHVNLVKASDLDEAKFETGLRELVGFLKRRDDKAAMMDYFEENGERIRNMDDETIDVVSVLLHLPREVTKMKKDTEGDRADMCRAMKEWLADERDAGKKEGIEEGEKRGEKRFASLTAALIASKRMNDLNRAVSDEAFRDFLYQEFAL